MCHKVCTHTGKICACLVNGFLNYAYGYVPVAYNAVAGVGDLGGEHLIVLAAETVEAVAAHGEQQGLLKLRLVSPSVVNGNLDAGTRVQGV